MTDITIPLVNFTGTIIVREDAPPPEPPTSSGKVRSVSTYAELEAAVKAPDLAFGDTILLHGGIYNEEQNAPAFHRGKAIAGTWVPPSLYDEDHPDKGYDLDTGNFIKIMPHEGEHPVIAKLRVIGNQASGKDQYFRFHGLTFSYPPLVPVTTGTYTQAALMIDLQARNCAIDHCEFYSQPDPYLGTQLQCYSGIYIGAGGVWVQDNYVHDVGSGIMSNTAVGFTGGDVYIIGNRVRRWYADGMSVLATDSNITLAWNEWSDFGALDQTPGAPGAGLHPDCLQFANASLSATNVRVICNRFQCGDWEYDPIGGAQGPFGGPNPVPISAGSISDSTLHVFAKGGPPITDNMELYGEGVASGTVIVSQLDGTKGGVGTYRVSPAQSVGEKNMMATHTIRDSVVAGNVIVTANMANLIAFNSWGDTLIANNTAVIDPMGVTPGSIYMTHPDGVEIKYNVANSVHPKDNIQTGMLARTPSVIEDNVNVPVDDYADFFIDPQSGTAITDLAAQYAIKAWINSPVKAGAHQDYIDWKKREHRFPWEVAS